MIQTHKAFAKFNKKILSRYQGIIVVIQAFNSISGTCNVSTFGGNDTYKDVNVSLPCVSFLKTGLYGLMLFPEENNSSEAVIVALFRSP